MTILLLLASLTAGPPTLSLPADEQTGRTAIVQFHDLDLSTSDGRAALDRRVKRAVKHVCELGGPTRPSDFERVSDCREQAWKDASRQIQLAAGTLPNDAAEWASK